MDIDPGAAPISCASRAMQRAPLPHMSASPPSGLKNRIRKSALLEGWIRRTPSEPTPVRRAAIAAIQFRSDAGNSSERSSTRMKSFAAPCIFQNGMFFMTCLQPRVICFASERSANISSAEDDRPSCARENTRITNWIWLDASVMPVKNAVKDCFSIGGSRGRGHRRHGQLAGAAVQYRPNEWDLVLALHDIRFGRNGVCSALAERRGRTISTEAVDQYSRHTAVIHGNGHNNNWVRLVVLTGGRVAKEIVILHSNGRRYWRPGC